MSRLGDIFKFSKPKGPGFGLVREFYYTVLAGHAPLPNIKQIIHPKGELGAVPGFGIPMAKGIDKSALEHPLERGTYGLVSMDRKSILSLSVLGREAAGFNPDVLIAGPFGELLPPEVRLRIASTWNMLQITIQSHHAQVFPTLEFMLPLAVRLATLTEGVVADPLCETYWLPEQLSDPNHFDVRNFVVPVKLEGNVKTKGMAKFGLPELVVPDVLPELGPQAGAALMAVANEVLRTGPPSPGDVFGPFQVAPVGDLTPGTAPVALALIPIESSVSEVLLKWRGAQ
ncbi:MAG: hypothetical protein JST40_05985 [Armatimonadetes bacterium]|nr:hypothetical protein [Armatimonadota bacterium]